MNEQSATDIIRRTRMVSALTRSALRLLGFLELTHDREKRDCMIARPTDDASPLTRGVGISE